MVDTIVKIIVTLALATILFAILPVSPFQGVIDTLAETPYLGYLNWFFPVGRCLTLMVGWCSAIGVFYGIQWILRQLGIIGA